MHSFFTELGRTVLDRWKATNFSLPAFPEIARSAIAERPPSEHIDLGAFVRDFLLEDEQPFQSSSGFGQPELIAYDHPRFYIQILFWLEGTTQIHQHEFSGAFHVMEGASLHSEFTFENPRPISAHFRLGDLRLASTRLLATGSTVPIISGGACIHSLFHLDTPSVTVVVRTHSDPGTGPQFTYLPPHVAVDPFFTDALTARRTQLLDVLERTGDPRYGELVREMVSELDLERGFFALQNCLGHLRSLGEWEATWEVFQKRHCKLADPIVPTLDEMIWRDTLVGFRAGVTDPEHRFFLALLLNVSSRVDLLEFVRARFGLEEAPTEIVMRWVEELLEVSEDGAWLLDAEFSPDLGGGSDDWPEQVLGGLSVILETGAGDLALVQTLENSSLRAITR